MKAQVGLYHVCQLRNSWCVYVYTHVTATSNSAEKVDSFPYFQDAIIEMYKLNGWGQPKNITKKF
jgi:hypothetical protein